MARFFVPPEQLVGGHVELDARTARHLVKVLRLTAGAEVQVFDGRGTEIEARVLRCDRNGVELALGERRAVATAPIAITLLQSLPRGDRMDWIVQKTTELGVGTIVPVIPERGMVRPASDRARRWQIIAREAARQSGRADVPEIREPVDLAAALAMPRAQGESRLVLWEEERSVPFRRWLAAQAPPACISVLIGPEGGFSAGEIASARGAGFVSVGLGQRILRVETAAVVAVALVQAAAGGLD